MKQLTLYAGILVVVAPAIYIFGKQNVFASGRTKNATCKITGWVTPGAHKGKEHRTMYICKPTFSPSTLYYSSCAKLDYTVYGRQGYMYTYHLPYMVKYGQAKLHVSTWAKGWYMQTTCMLSSFPSCGDTHIGIVLSSLLIQRQHQLCF